MFIQIILYIYNINIIINQNNSNNNDNNGWNGRYVCLVRRYNVFCIFDAFSYYAIIMIANNVVVITKIYCRARKRLRMEQYL